MRSRYPGKSRSWVRRSLRRFLSNDVRTLGSNAWVVRGEPSMGDRLPQYIVRFINGKYVCDCQMTAWSSSREICTHIGAVLISQLYEEFMKTTYAAIVEADCVDNELIILGNNEVVVDRVAQGGATIYVVRTRQEATIKALLACNDEIRELIIGTKPMKGWEVMKVMRSNTAHPQ
ncbi:hypothetical protein [Vulcanisaeta distributa]|uniref:hypothetical protein n=1 Tax=Vulcanisaeta distributa TaxID=164451 RepID=UPI001FE222FA|nr:hypothetical protein [Vulcanisaeta distributa]